MTLDYPRLVCTVRSNTEEARCLGPVVIAPITGVMFCRKCGDRKPIPRRTIAVDSTDELADLTAPGGWP